ncbi:MAG: hypothetical protein R3236_09600, partial [Phycisphaeraceae bacterium]|nr:hypothetical protein [Phycisphaeraceae bacterium]
MNQPNRQRPPGRTAPQKPQRPKTEESSEDKPEPIRSDRASLKSLSWVLRFTVAFMCLAMAADIYVNDSWVAAYVTKQWPQSVEHIDKGANWFQTFMSQQIPEGDSILAKLS